jgi:nitroimidazol reductase NimA-like FMN-containing flavoprotein (pyridoxamine 5'-phosphate oxidase superfamily)
LTPPERDPALGLLSRSDCLEALANDTIGRVAVVVDGKPLIFPVNYVMDGEMVVFLTAENAVLAHAGMTEVAFEIDYIDEASRAGWNVLVEGQCFDITDALDTTSERLRELSLHSWLSDPRERRFAIHPRFMTGRQLRRLPLDT